MGLDLLRYFERCISPTKQELLTLALSILGVDSCVLGDCPWQYLWPQASRCQEYISVPSCDTQKHLQMLPVVPWGKRFVALKNLSYKMMCTCASFYTGNFIVFGILWAPFVCWAWPGKLSKPQWEMGTVHFGSSFWESYSWILSVVMRIRLMFGDSHYNAFYQKGRWNRFM